MIHPALPVATRLAGATAMLAAALTLAACGSGPSTATAAGAARSAVPAGSADPAAGASPAGPAAGTTATGTTTTGTTAAGAAGTGTVATGSSGGSGSACRNLAASATIKQAVTAAHRAYSHLVHIQPEPGAFYYGSCAGVQYAGVVFQAGPGAGQAEAVGLQDDGSAMQYYQAQAGTPWRHVASDSLPRDPRGCAAIGALPAALSTLWAGCPLPGSAGTAPAVPSLMSLGNPVQRPASAVLSGDSTLGLQAMSWTGWGTTTATGSGTGWVDDCNPTCAAGTIHREPTQITLTSPATACGIRYFEQAELRWTATVPPGLPRLWAVALQQPICH
jgi:hypothetical protein